MVDPQVSATPQTPSTNYTQAIDSPKAAAANASSIQKRMENISIHKLERGGSRGNSVHLEMEQAKLSPHFILYFSILLSLIGPFQYGWSLSQLNLATYHDEKDCAVNPIAPDTCVMFPSHTALDWTLMVNAWILGGAIGGFLSGPPSDRFGRKHALMANCFVMIIGAFTQAFSTSVGIFVFGRFVAGLASGFAAAVSGVYISEVSPPHLRGGLTSMMHLSIVVGIFAVSCVHFGAGSEIGWRLVAGFPAVLAIVHLIGSYFIMVESPPWLLSKGQTQEARTQLGKVFGTENIDIAMSWMEDTGEQEHAESKWSELFCKQYSRQLIVAVGVSMAQQLSGINAVFYYSSHMFREAGVKDERVGSAIVTFISAATTGMAIFVINCVRKRVLLLAGTFAMCLSALGMTLALVLNVDILSIVFTSTYVAGFSFSLGPLAWVLMAELFPEHVRAKAMSIGAFTHWACNMIVGVSYPYIASALGDLGFVPFAVILGASLIFIYFTVPETSGKTIDEIQAEFQQKIDQEQSIQ